MRNKLNSDASFTVLNWQPLRLAAFVLATAIVAFQPALGQSRNGFDLSNSLVPTSEIVSSSLPKDGIPAIDRPKFTSSSTASHLRDDDMVVSVTLEEETRAYPLRILEHHEVVNDQIGGIKFFVTYCPLCGTAMVFNRYIGNRVFTFGVSGLLYQSDVLLYDRETESLWSQLGMKCVSGPQQNSGLAWLPSEQMTWGVWKRRYPRGSVLSPDTGHGRDYSQSSYAAYESSPETLFPVPLRRSELPKKSWVLGVFIGNSAKAYPIELLPSGQVISDSLNGFGIQLSYDAASRQGRVTYSGSDLSAPSVQAYWFAWQAFYPTTELWHP